MGIIYQAVNNKTERRYIGQTTKTLEGRKQEHRSAMTKQKWCHLYFYRALQKYGWDSFSWSVLEECPDCLVETTERAWIGLYKVMGVKLYNLTDGGEGIKGYAHSDDARKKISDAKSRTHTAINPNGDRVTFTNAFRFAIQNGLNASHFNRMLNGEIKHCSGWHLGNYDGNHPLANTYVVINPSGEEITFTNINKFAKEHGLDVGNFSRMLSGKRKHCNGWKRA